jgi:hypothetical protein
LNVTASTGVTNVSGAAWTWDPVASTQSLTLGTIGLLSNQLSYDLMAAELAFDRTALTAGPFTSNVELRTSERFALVPTLGWQPAGDRAVRVTRATAALALHPDIEPMWRNRIVTDLNISTSVTANLLRFTESLFNITFSTTVAVYRFVTVSLRATSTNDQIYVYIPALAGEVGREWRNPLVDLARSFNFFSRSDRTWSAFNLRQIEFNLQHELGDWDLTVSYGGAPTLTDLENGSKAYKWRGTLNLNLEWRPIRELRTEITADPDDITFGSDS